MRWDDRVGRRLKLRDLHILMSVAQCGSMRKAAAELAISQPAISKAIADIEHTLKVRPHAARRRTDALRPRDAQVG